MNYVDTKSCNIKNYDAYARILLALLILVFVFYFNDYYLLLILVLPLLYTGFKKHCYIYDLLKRDGKFSIKNYYMSQLPKYDTTSEFVFNTKGELYFRNKSAKNTFSHINSIEDFKLDISITDLTNEENITLFYSYMQKHYQLNIKIVENINSILLYAVDISQIVNLNHEIEETQKELIYTMGEVAEKKSSETGHHVKRVAHYSELLAMLYGLNQNEAKRLKLASPMHDIGKIGIPDHILNKPGKLTDDEFEVMKEHALFGHEMLNKSNRPIIQAASIVAHQHHERYDGRGYPLGLKGSEIHIYGRITALVDVFDALSSKRVYKKAWELYEILEYISEEKGKHFDPELVDLFLENLDMFLEIKKKYSS